MPSTLVNPFEALHEYPDERAIESRPDVLTFTTSAQEEPVTLAGRVVAHLSVSSDAPSMYLHVKLVDVHADGRAHALLFGQQVVESDAHTAPAEVYLGHTGYRVQAGHRLRLQVALERLSGLPAASGHGGEPMGCDRDADEPADPGDGRRHAFVPQPHHPAIGR